MTLSWKSFLLYSASLTLFQITLKGREFRLHLLKGGISKNLWAYLKATTSGKSGLGRDDGGGGSEAIATGRANRIR